MITLPPEIYPTIVKHLPLYATPPTLLSLALSNRRLSDIILPILQSRLILKDESTTISILDRIADEPEFGRKVRELHILSHLSIEIQTKGPPHDVLGRIERVVSTGSIPFIHTLGLSLGSGWYYRPERNFEQVQGFGVLSKDFWSNLRKQCPRLRGLILRGFHDDQHNSWMEDPTFVDLDDISSLTMRLTIFPSASFCDRHFKRISSFTGSLHTLAIDLPSPGIPAILDLDMPCLRSITIANALECGAERTTSFFQRHSSLEYLDIGSILANENNHRLFKSEVPAGFLPNLRYLKAKWVDARSLAPVLHQLRDLVISSSINAQVPYLFREVLPEGLPELRSLSIFQSGQNIGQKKIEGALWYETEDGEFCQFKPNRNRELRTLFDGYMHSIVRAAPNLEELEFSTNCPLTKLPSIAEDLNGFQDLEHLSYSHAGATYFKVEDLVEEELDTFRREAAALFDAVPGLMSITNAATRYRPYLTARAKRDESDGLVDIEVGKGYGMLIGYDDEAFPGPWPL